MIFNPDNEPCPRCKGMHYSHKNDLACRVRHEVAAYDQKELIPASPDFQDRLTQKQKSKLTQVASYHRYRKRLRASGKDPYAKPAFVEPLRVIEIAGVK